jgi:p-aminobenzoyl-glutamate transporter AbgT
MWLKIVILALFAGLLISLGAGFFFLIKDQGETRRAWQSLTFRLVLAFLMMGFLIYGVVTGQLGSKAPWDAYKAPQANSLNDVNKQE